MKKSWLVLLTTVCLALVGAVVSFNLTIKHQVKSTGLAWFDNACDGGDESSVSCDQVMASKWGYLPPIPQDAASQDRLQPVWVLGLFQVTPRPSALCGLFYFSAMAAWYVAIGRPGHSRRYYHLIPLLLNVLGVGGAAFFVYVMFTNLEAWCPWCMVVHGINALMLVGAVLLWPRKPQIVVPVVDRMATRPADEPAAETAASTPESPSDEESPATSPEQPDCPAPAAPDNTATVPPVEVAPRRHPQLRLVLVTLGAIVAVVAAEDHFNVALTHAKLSNQRSAENLKLRAALKNVQDDARILYSMYSNGTKYEIPRRADDPMLNEGPNRLSVVVFSDFQCPHCAKFAKKLEEEIAPLFDGHLRTTFKHFPANKKCNRHVVRDLHPHACTGSLAAEAARKLGGNDAFWKTHDLLFASRKELGKKEFYRRLADRLGLDPDTFIETMDSEDLKARLVDDIALGKKIGVNATPAIFVAERRVPRIAVLQMHYWQMLANNFKSVLKKKLAKQAKEREKRKQEQKDDPEAAPGQ